MISMYLASFAREAPRRAGLAAAAALVALVGLLAPAAGCAKAAVGGDANPAATADAANAADASCGSSCDSDHDGVPDGRDKCPGTPAGAMVNHNGCADSQLTPVLQPNFPPYGLAWTHTGDPGRAGGLTWTYSGIIRGDLFHIYWIVCDDPMTPCGLSLDGPIDTSEHWTLSINDTDLPNGKLVFTNMTHIALADGTTPALTGRLTVTIVDDAGAAIPFANVIVLGVTPRAASYGAEIKSPGFKVVVVEEVQDPTSGTWTPALDYYDAAPTPAPADMDAGGNVYASFDGAFYDK